MNAETTRQLYGDPPSLGNHAFGSIVGIPPPKPRDLPMKQYRGHSLAQPYNLRERLKRAEDHPLMGWMSILPSPDIIRLVACAGLDFAMIDWEHSPVDIREICDLVRWVNMSSEGNTAAVVRVPNGDHHHIAWVLDAGASGVIVPHVETVEQAEAAVRACRFPISGGQRSYPPSFVPAFCDGVPENKTIFDIWDQAAVIVQIESRAGCENASEIGAVPGVDALMVGNVDLRLDLGLMPSFDGAEQPYIDNVNLVLKAAKANSLPPMILTAGQDLVHKRLTQGFRIFVLDNEGFALARATRAALASGDEAVQMWRNRHRHDHGRANGNEDGA